jgi:hypothetical protein
MAQDFSNETITPLRWNNGFEMFPMVRISTIPDGSCFFHAILRGYFIPYLTRTLNNHKISRREIVRRLREELAINLAKHSNPTDPYSPINYDTLSRGQMREMAKTMPEYTLESMQRLINSSEPVGYEILEYVMRQLNINIYLLEEAREDVYISGDEDLYYDKERKSVVLYVQPKHYELIGLYVDGQIQTFFNDSHPFIQLIRSRIRARTLSK